jgi:hypothetical protein
LQLTNYREGIISDMTLVGWTPKIKIGLAFGSLSGISAEISIRYLLKANQGVTATTVCSVRM